MDQTANAALITSIIAVVLGGLGLIGGVVGYVQGAAALRRATAARQRAAAAEEAALQARTSAEATVREAEALTERLRPLRPEEVQTGPIPLPDLAPQQPARTTRTDPVDVAAPVVSDAPEDEPAAAPVEPEPEPVLAPGESEPTADEPDDAAPVEAGEATSDGSDEAASTATVRPGRGQVAAGAQDAPTMDWAETLRTGAIPLPSKSRGTYSAPHRRPKPTGEGPARFELKMIGRQRFEAVNVGGEPASDAVVEGAGDDPHLVRPLSTRPITVPPGGALAFSILRVEGRDAAVEVRWSAAGETRQQELPLG